MNKIRIEQRKGETSDLTVMRAFGNSLELMPRHVAIAAARWMFEKAADKKTVTKDEFCEPNPDKVKETV